MTVRVGATIGPHTLTHAALGSGIPLDTPKSGFIRAALAVAAGIDKESAVKLARDQRESASESDDQIIIVGRIPDEYVEKSDAKYSNRAFAVRVGMAMLAGASREAAESFARMSFGPKRSGSAA